MTTGLVPDIMHDILEGSLEVCLRHMLIFFIREKKYFTLNFRNSTITALKYGPSEVKNKPTPIAPGKLTSEGHLKQLGTVKSK